MVQRLKPEVRQRILDAAALVFAEDGFEKARLADIAKRAGTVTSNLYKYFKNKEEVFYAVVPPSHAAQLLRLLRARLRELEARGDWLESNQKDWPAEQAQLDFWVSERLSVLILLRGANGTRYDHIRDLFIKEMERQTLNYLRKNSGLADPDEHLNFILHRQFTRTAEMIVDILECYCERSDIEATLTHFWRFQLAGLSHLLKG